MTLKNAQEGSALLITLLVLLALTTLGLATVYFAGQHNEIAISARAGDQTLYFAEAGVNYGMDYVLDNGLASASAGYETPGYPNPATGVVIRDVAGNPVVYSGPSGAVSARVAVKVGPSFDGRGQGVSCGIVGFSERFGSPRFMLEGVGAGPQGARRSVEAHVLLPPREGLCPPGANVAGGYAGSV